MEMVITVPVLVDRSGNLWPAKIHQLGIVQADSAVRQTQSPEDDSENIFINLSHSVPDRTS